VGEAAFRFFEGWGIVKDLGVVLHHQRANDMSMNTR